MNTEEFVSKRELEEKLDEIDPQKDINALHRKISELEQKLDHLSFAVVTLIYRDSHGIKKLGHTQMLGRLWNTGSTPLSREERKYLEELVNKLGAEEIIKEFLSISYPNNY